MNELFTIRRTSEHPQGAGFLSINPDFVRDKLTTNTWFSHYLENAIWISRKLILRLVDCFCILGEQAFLEVVDADLNVVDHESWRTDV